MTTQEIITSFRQGADSANCVSVAVIKASVEVFGLTGVFSKIAREAELTTVTLRDGISVSLEQEEIDLAAHKSGFILGTNKALYDFAILAFAVMGKRAQRAHNEGAATFEEALETLCNGEDFTKGPSWLGLDRYALRIKKRDIWKHAGVVGTSAKHCFFASFGWEDAYGTPDKITQLEMLFNGSRFLYFYRITPTPV